MHFSLNIRCWLGKFHIIKCFDDFIRKTNNIEELTKKPFFLLFLYISIINIKLFISMIIMEIISLITTYK